MTSQRNSCYSISSPGSPAWMPDENASSPFEAEDSCSPMALWAKSQQLQGESLRQVQDVYGDHFPIEVRHILADWIEEKPWKQIDPDNPAHEQYAATLINSLIVELESKAAQLNGTDYFVMKIKLTDAAVKFRQSYTHNPLALVRIITHCLNTEMNLVHLVDNPPLPGDLSDTIIPMDRNQEITKTLETLRRRTQETEEELRRMHQDQESFVIEYQDSSKLQAHLAQITSQPNGQNEEAIRELRRRKEQAEQHLSERAVNLHDMRQKLEKKHEETFKSLNALQSLVLDEELIRWKREQQLAGNGAPFHSNLDTIQEWCEALAEIIWLNRQQIKRVEILRAQLPIGPPSDTVPTLKSQITSLLSSLVTSTFIIEKQPPQVMKTNTRMTATVRLLVGGKLSVHMTPPQVKVTIISEVQANQLLKSEMNKGESSGEILNNSGTMEYHQQTRQLSVSFRNMQLRKIKRAEKKGTESVMDEKFSLLFQSQFKVGGGELVFQVWTLSLPVVVIVHGNQEPHAWATVSWDNAFAEPGRVPFAVPEKFPWSEVAKVLSCKFKALTGRGLDEDNLRFLAGKAFRNAHMADYSNCLLTWSQFCKDPLPDRSFTFWEWFYAIMKLTKEHLRGPWNDGAVMGFVTRHLAEGMLKERCSGTFLLRFSDSELGGVTIAWGESDSLTDNVRVQMLQPFTNKDFLIRSLADRINDLKQFVFLYPNIPKDQAYQKYYSNSNSQPTTINGYVSTSLVTSVPSCFSNGTDSHPATPRPHPTPSPDVHPHDSTMDTINTVSLEDLALADWPYENDFPAVDLDDVVDNSSYYNMTELLAFGRSNLAASDTDQDPPKLLGQRGGWQ